MNALPGGRHQRQGAGRRDTPRPRAGPHRLHALRRAAGGQPRRRAAPLQVRFCTPVSRLSCQFFGNTFPFVLSSAFVARCESVASSHGQLRANSSASQPSRVDPPRHARSHYHHSCCHRRRRYIAQLRLAWGDGAELPAKGSPEHDRVLELVASMRRLLSIFLAEHTDTAQCARCCRSMSLIYTHCKLPLCL